MKKERFFELLNNIDEDLLIRAEHAKPIQRKKHHLWVKCSVAAACLCLSIGAVLAVSMQHAQPPVVTPDQSQSSINSTTSAVSELSTSTDSNAMQYQFAYINNDWPYYGSAEELINASTNIFYGQVSDISFEVLNMKTGKVAEVDTESSLNMLYTIYTIEVSENLKGENSSEVKICRLGGMVGYNEQMQGQLAEKYGLTTVEYTGIPALANAPILSTEKTYLFCTRRSDGDYDFIININQFALEPDSALATSISRVLK